MAAGFRATLAFGVGEERRIEASPTLLFLLPRGFALDCKSATSLLCSFSFSFSGNISHPSLGNSCGVSHSACFRRCALCEVSHSLHHLASLLPCLLKNRTWTVEKRPRVYVLPVTEKHTLRLATCKGEQLCVAIAGSQGLP